MWMVYETSLLSSKSLTKAFMWLLHNLCQEFFEAAKDCNLIDGSVNLNVLNSWLKRKLKTYFNPLANIIAAENASRIYQNPKKNKDLKVNNILNEKKDDNIVIIVTKEPFLDPYWKRNKNQVATKENDSITCNKIYDRDTQNNLTYLQVLPINILTGDKTFRANTLLDSVSDSTLISKTLSGKLNLCGGERSLTITNVTK